MWLGLIKLDDEPSPKDQEKVVPAELIPVDVLVKAAVRLVELAVKFAKQDPLVPQ